MTRPDPIIRYCEECGYEKTFTAKKCRNRYYFHGMCDDCWYEHRSLRQKQRYRQTKKRPYEPPSDKCIEEASVRTPCANCIFLGICDYLVKTLEIDPLCFVNSDDHDKFLEQYETCPKSRTWKREVVVEDVSILPILIDT